MIKTILCLYREAGTMGDNPRNNLFIHGLTIARRSLAQWNSNTNMTAAGISAGKIVVIYSS